MRKTLKHLTRVNQWLLALSWLAGLWALVKFAFICLSPCFQGIRNVISVLIGLALTLQVTAHFQSRLKCTNRQQRLHCLIAAKQQRAMAGFLFLEACLIAFMTLISYAVTV